jgi:ketosteroid isomerase-like protein
LSTPLRTRSEQAAPTSAPDDPITDPATIHHRFCEACNAGDLDRLVELYEHGAVIVERTGELAEGSEAIREHLSNLLAMQPAMTILDSNAVIAGELAQLSSHWRCVAATPDGSTVELEYHGSELARHQPDGSWRLVIDNPWGAAAAGA